MGKATTGMGRMVGKGAGKGARKGMEKSKKIDVRETTKGGDTGK